MARCKFCKDYEKLKDRARDLKKMDGINVTFHAEIGYRHTTCGVRIDQGVFDRTYPLHHCPQCGTKLIKARRQKKQL